MLWIAVLVVLGAYVVADFVRSPFLAPAGSAAVPREQLTIAAPAAELGGESGAIESATVRGLEELHHPTATRSLAGGSSEAVVNFLSRRRAGAELLLVSSMTLADIAHDRRDRLVPGAAERAALARALLRRAVPVALLASDPAELAVPAGAGIHSAAALLGQLRANPTGRLFAVDDETWSRDELAALVDRAGVDGRVRFGVFGADGGAGQAVAAGLAGTALSTSGELHEARRAGRLRTLPWPAAAGPAPRAWVGLVARPGIGAADLARLRRWARQLSSDRRWGRSLRASGRSPAAAGGEALRHLLLDAGSDRLERLARRVERG